MKCQICDSPRGSQIRNPDGTVEYICQTCLGEIHRCSQGIKYQIEDAQRRREREEVRDDAIS